MAFRIDHLFTVTLQREPARLALSELGFELTARGEHPGRGTSNHLMFFGRCYWELLSIDEPTPANSALQAMRHPLCGCALRTDDVTRDAAEAQRLGAQPGPIESLTRPVQIDSQWLTARFKIATLRPQIDVDAFLFFCQHLTPELVWPRAPVQHPNGAIRLRALYVVGPDIAAAERGLRPLLASNGGEEPQIRYLSPADYRSRFDPVAARPIDALPGMVGLEFQVQDLDRCAAELRGRNVHFRRAAGELHVHSEQLGHVIVFSA